MRRPGSEMTAYHEAGHAVAAHVRGRPFVKVTIAPDADPLGRVRCKRFLARSRPDVSASDHTGKTIETTIITALSGPAGERAFSGAVSRARAAGDRATAADMACHATGSAEAASAYARYLWIVARDLMRAQWPRVQTVAASLLAKQVLTSEEVAEIISSAEPRR